MGGFVATNAPPVETPITNAPFFPAIDPADFRASVRQDATITPERLKAALLAAITEVNDELAYFTATQQAAGHTTLAEVPAVQINDESRLVQCYRRAVYALTKAALLEHYRDFDATRSGQLRAEDQPDPETVYRRDARWAIADLIGRPRTTVELI